MTPLNSGINWTQHAEQVGTIRDQQSQGTKLEATNSAKGQELDGAIANWAQEQEAEEK